MKQTQEKLGQTLKAESLSALMDGEADELELHRLLKLSGDGKLRRQWTRWQVARAALHRKTQQIQVPEDFAARVAAALQEEASAPAAARAARRLPWQRRRWLAAFGQVAVTASVALAVLGGVRLYQGFSERASSPALAQQRAALPTSGLFLPPEGAQPAAYGSTMPRPPAALPVPTLQADWQLERLPDYLRGHSHSGLQGIEGVLPYARAASFGEQ